MSNHKKPNILLDLDETLINSIYPTEFKFEKNTKKAKDFFTFYDMDKDYIIFERPGLQPFLDYLFENFNVSVWTAASKSYALFIIDTIILQNKPNRKLEYILFDYHCNISKKNRKCAKKLEMLWEYYGIREFNERNTIIFDDNTDVYNGQTGNCLIAKPFEFEDNGSERDNFLETVTPVLEKIRQNILDERDPFSGVEQKYVHQ